MGIIGEKPANVAKILLKRCHNADKVLDITWQNTAILYFPCIFLLRFVPNAIFVCDEPTFKKKNFKNGHTLSNTFKMALQVNFTTTFEISMTLLPSLSFPQVSKPTGHHCLCFFQYREPAHPEYQLISLSFSAAVVTRWDVST